ncbi:hypothetical protein DLJ53_17485 [Acuticoccus sediminis]|uniref:Uncharacterized protein n=1 Tax=Acuticoccus sediminis TaxID=2184697 RepID=A0A8B2NMU8_9HYPH|nr:hypothetical protein [Acuticoccus sediminis]RAI01016.1 hypothetical protein DLJ53_17485 [Acuticoccus sediminis]
MSILLGPLASELTAALEAEGVPYDIVVTRTVTTGGDPWNPTTEDVDYPCRGWRDAWMQGEVDGTLVLQSDSKIVVLALSIGIVPTTADTITLDGLTYAIIDVSADPAGATFTVQARR